MAKKEAPKPKQRVFQILVPGHRGIIAVRGAATPKQVLDEYFNESLAPKGYHSPKRVGNTLQVLTRQGTTEVYSAVDVA